MGLIINGKGWKVANGEAVQCQVDEGFKEVTQKQHFANLRVIDSVKAGKAQSSAYLSALKPLLDAAQITHSYLATTSPTSIADFAASLCPNDTAGTYLFISGDTSIHEFINGLKEPQKFQGKLAVVPAGTGNAFANSLGLGAVEDAIDRFFTGSPDQFPIYLTTTGDQSLYTLVVLSYGFHANLIDKSDTPEYRRLGNERFQVVANQLVAQSQRYRCRIYTDNSEVPLPKDETSYLLFTTMKMLEPGFVISPEGDGKHLYLVRIDAPDNLMDYMMMAYDGGSHVKEANVDYLRVDSARFTVPVGSAICVDGFILKSGNEVAVNVGIEVGIVV